MNRDVAIAALRARMDEFPKLRDWSIRVTTSANDNFLGMCSYVDKCIFLNGYHLDIHPEAEVLDTINHEVAHALVGNGQGHNAVWQKQATELGASPNPCSVYSLPKQVIDEIRMGSSVEVIWEDKNITRTETVKVPVMKATRLQDRCEVCNKVAIEKSHSDMDLGGEFIKRFVTLECGHTRVRNLKRATPYHTFISNRDLPHVASCQHEWGTDYSETQCKHCGEFMPYPFQIEGMLKSEIGIAVHNGFCYFDDMGLGKTVEALGTIAFNPSLWPVLYVVKSKLRFQWFKQSLVWLGPEHLAQIINGSNDYLIPGLKGYIISYDMLVHKTRISKKTQKVVQQGFDIAKFEKLGIKCMVLDECQMISNTSSERAKQVRRIAKYAKVIPLSGTPWKNKGRELYNALNMAAPTLFPSEDGFVKAWLRTYYSGNRDKEGGIADPVKFKKYTEDVVIRHEFAEVMKQMPPVTRQKLYIELNADEAAVYEEAVDEFVTWYKDAILEGKDEHVGSIHIIAKMAKMRHLTGLAKIDATINHAEEFIENTESNLLIYVHHQDVGKIMVQKLKESFAGQDVNVFAMSADVDGQARYEMINAFNAGRSVMVASTLSGGEGVDGLQKSAYTLIMHERQWNPANEEQPEKRLLRIGQQSKVINSIYAEATGSIDEELDVIVGHKRREFHHSHNKGELIQWSEDEIVKELASIIVRKHLDKKRKSA